MTSGNTLERKLSDTKTELPFGWECPRLGDIVAIKYGKGLPTKHLIESGYPVFGANGVIGFHKEYLYEDEQVLISCRGAYSGKINWSPAKCFVTNNSLVLEVPKGRESIRKYLFYALQAIDKSKLVTGSAQPQVTINNAEALRVPIAPKDQQKSIVAEIEKQFSRLDEAVANLKRVKANLRRHKAAVLKAAIEGKLTEDWRKQHPDVEPAGKLLERILVERRKKWNGRGKYKEPSAPEASTLPTLPERWIWTNVDQLAEVGTGATPRRGKAQYYSGGHIPWVTSSALNKAFVDKADKCVTDTALQETNLTLYPPGTLLLAMYGEGRTRGKCSELHIHATTNQAIAAIKCSGEGRDYLKLAIWNQYEDLRRTASGGVQPNLNLSLVRSITIPFPPLVEQQHMVTEVERRLSVIDELEAAVQANLTRANRLRQSILKKAFSGGGSES